jgi:sterol desaturase/sphingolipid hydroxylase (fatty acid hydroxylase superfamily)
MPDGLAHAFAVAVQTLTIVYAEPALWIGTAVLLLLERRFPVHPRQRTWRVGLAHDAVWFGVTSIAHVLVLSAWAAALTVLYQTYCPWLTITAVGRLPTPAKWALWVLAVDLLEWCHHRLKHAVPWLWQFHAVHHSQRELNLFTDMRYHHVEYLVSRTVMTFPLLMLQANLAEVTYYGILHGWYTRLIHTGIRTDLGPLRHLLVTPQSHRVHHSIEPAHTDRNFGVIFACWDVLFGTQYRGWNEYPATGVRDPHFPVERSANALALAGTLIRQHLYPFAVILRALRARASRASSSRASWDRSWQGAPD